jgi:choline dehydrogenase-like flavoprotein
MSPLKKLLEISLEACQAVEFDYLVIGSGAAGTSTAITLADQGFNILVVEAGPLLLTEHIGVSSLRHNPNLIKAISSAHSISSPWHDNEGISNQEQVWSVAGGRTLFWGGHTPRFLNSDFAMWPIQAQALQEDYQWAENFLGVSSTFFANASQDFLLELAKIAQINVQAASLAIHHDAGKTALPNLIYSGISRLLSNPHFTNDSTQVGIHLLCDTKALSLIHQQERIHGLQVRNQRTQALTQLTAKNYVLACGALRSNQLVLNSSMHFDSPVGHKLSEHLFCKGLIRLHQPLKDPIYLHAPSSERDPFLFELHGPLNRTWYDDNHATVWLDWKENTQYLLLYGFGVAEIIPENRVVLSTNPHGYQVYYQHTARDQQTFQGMMEKAQRLATSLNGTLEQIELQAPGASYHERGGLVMGHNPRECIVNSQGAFWNYSNLYCTDSAIWPSQGAANSCLTITAVAHHLMKKVNGF